MVSGYSDDVGSHIQQARDTLIQLFKSPDLGVKVAVLPCRVGGLVVEEEEVVIVRSWSESVSSSASKS